MEDCALSPVLSARRDDLSQALEEYDAALSASAKKCNTLFDLDASLKDLQSDLFELLSKGDDHWDNIQKKKDKEQLQLLKDCISLMRTNIKEQDKTLGHIEKAAAKVVRYMDALSKTLSGMKDHIKSVETSFEERVKVMEKTVPDLKSSKHKSSSTVGLEDLKNKQKHETRTDLKEALEEAARKGAEIALAIRDKSARRKA